MFWEKIEELNKRFDSIKLVPLSFFGFGLIRIWLLSLNSVGLPIGGFHGAALTFRLVEIIALVALAFVARKTGSLYRSATLFLAAPLLTMGGAVLLKVCAGYEVLVQTGGVLSAVGYALFLALWLELYGCLPVRLVIMAYAGSDVVADLSCRLLVSFSPSTAFMTLILMPLVSSCCFLRCLYRPETVRRESLGAYKSDFPPFRRLMRLLTWVVCFSMVAGFFTNGEMRLGISVARICIALFILAGLTLFNDRFDSNIMYRLSLPFIILGLVIAPLLDSSSEATSLFVSVGKECTMIVAVAIACNLSYRRHVSAAWAGGLVFAANCMALLLGNVLRSNVHAISQTLGISDLAVIVFLCVLSIVVATLVFNEKHFFTRWDKTDLRTDHNAYSLGQAAGTVRKLTEEFSLSEREAEILLFLMQGKGYQEIGDELFISPSTVRTYASRLYAKFGVRDKEALLVWLLREE